MVCGPAAGAPALAVSHGRPATLHTEDQRLDEDAHFIGRAVDSDFITVRCALHLDGGAPPGQPRVSARSYPEEDRKGRLSKGRKAVEAK